MSPCKEAQVKLRKWRELSPVSTQYFTSLLTSHLSIRPKTKPLESKESKPNPLTMKNTDSSIELVTLSPTRDTFTLSLLLFTFPFPFQSNLPYPFSNSRNIHLRKQKLTRVIHRVNDRINLVVAPTFNANSLTMVHSVGRKSHAAQIQMSKPNSDLAGHSHLP
ncbi:hypothetical protein VNO77_12576 [Canavalia gladiata]|uniref:Uncharacterized protein n=1 Tax=Canavalia gladiata TaxID=3824 RepID=A0AAN9LWF7_CANGL